MFLPVFDINYLFYMVPGILLSLLAQFYVKSQYSRWSKVQNQSRLTGAQVAQRLSERLGMYDLKLKAVPGQLTDHYDPRNKVLGLSQEIGQRASVASMAIAAHELGHAQQDKDSYLPMRIRTAMVPVVNIGSSLGYIFIMIGLFLQIGNLAMLGVLFFSAGVLFAIATLPVELNASRRARQMLQANGMIASKEEQRGVSKVLNAAALTYVAAVATSLMQLLYFVTLAGGRRRR